VALGLAAVLLVGAAVAPARSVLTVWLTFYYVAGAVSLFAHMAGQVQPRPSDATSRL
jgi:hypothetical protein